MATDDTSELTRRMAGPDGKLYDIPYSQVEQAHNDGLEFTTNMVDPKGGNKTYSIPNSQIEQARKDGLSDFDAPPTLTTPYEQKLADQTRQAREDSKGVLGRAKDSFVSEFLSGGATDIRNIPEAIGLIEAVPESVGMLMAKGASGAKQAWNAATTSRLGTQLLQRSTGLVDRAGDPIMRNASAGELADTAWQGTKNVASSVGSGVVSLGKWLGQKAGKMIGYGAGGAAAKYGWDEVKKNSQD